MQLAAEVEGEGEGGTAVVGGEAVKDTLGGAATIFIGLVCFLMCEEDCMVLSESGQQNDFTSDGEPLLYPM